MKFNLKSKESIFISVGLVVVICIVIATLAITMQNKEDNNKVVEDTKKEEIVKVNNDFIPFIEAIAGLEANSIEIINDPVVGIKGELFAPTEAILSGIDYFLEHTENDKMTDLKIDIGEGYISVNVNYKVTEKVKTPIAVKVIPALDNDENLVLNIKEVKLLDLKIANWIVNLALDNFIEDWFPKDGSLKVDFNKGNVLVYKENFNGVNLKEIVVKESGLKVRTILDLKIILN